MGAAGHHIIPLKTFVMVLGSLLVLTVVTVAIAQVDFGPILNFTIAMAIASVKAGLVMAYFMHMKYDDRLYLALIGLSVFFLVLMFFFCQLDIVTRPIIESVL